jgi:hypothetical protein
MNTRIPLRMIDNRAKDMAEKLEMSTAEIGLSVRTTNCLEDRGIFTVNDLRSTICCTALATTCWPYRTSARRPWKKCTRRWSASVFFAVGNVR